MKAIHGPPACASVYQGWSAIFTAECPICQLWGPKRVLNMAPYFKEAKWPLGARLSSWLHWILFTFPILLPFPHFDKYPLQRHSPIKIFMLISIHCLFPGEPNLWWVSGSMPGDLHVSSLLLFTTPCEMFWMVAISKSQCRELQRWINLPRVLSLLGPTDSTGHVWNVCHVGYRHCRGKTRALITSYHRPDIVLSTFTYMTFNFHSKAFKIECYPTPLTFAHV